MDHMGGGQATDMTISGLQAKLKTVTKERDKLDRDFNALLDATRKMHLRIAKLEEPELLGNGFSRGGDLEARIETDRILTTLYSGRFTFNETLGKVLETLKTDE